MKIIDCEQGSKEWDKIRCGIPTASNFDKIITASGMPSTQRDKYLYRLAGERITKCPETTYQSEAMLRGQQLEDEARKYYEFATGVKVKRVGFCLEANPGYGCSPDGMVVSNGLIEIKCPIMSTHVSYLLKNKLPAEYWQQTQGQLLVTGYKWVDFVSYFPGMKPLIIRVKPDKAFQVKLKKELVLFCAELDKIVRRIR